MNNYEIKVKSEMYGVTDCVITSEVLTGKMVFPCGSGEDHKLTAKELKQAKDYFNKKAVK